jgi:general secretion pathway protein C
MNGSALMQAWRLRFQEQGPIWVSWFLAALLAAEVAHAVVANFSGRPGEPAAPAFHRAPPPIARLDPRAIVAAHLFGVASAKSVRDPAAAMPTTANLHLRGTLATADPRRGWAIIADDRAEKVYRVGQAAGALSLYSVYVDHVLLDREGSLESLALPRAAERSAWAPAASPVAAPAINLEERHRLADVMRAEPAVDEESNKLLGFRIDPIPPASALVRAGLRPRDLVTAVNGTPLADQDRQRSQEIMNEALASGSASLSVIRGGQHVDVAVDVSR